jgi:hypothetical protein
MHVWAPYGDPKPNLFSVYPSGLNVLCQFLTTNDRLTVCTFKVKNSLLDAPTKDNLPTELVLDLICNADYFNIGH